MLRSQPTRGAEPGAKGEKPMATSSASSRARTSAHLGGKDMPWPSSVESGRGAPLLLCVVSRGLRKETGRFREYGPEELDWRYGGRELLPVCREDMARVGRGKEVYVVRECH